MYVECGLGDTVDRYLMFDLAARSRTGQIDDSSNPGHHGVTNPAGAVLFGLTSLNGSG
jgi:hypothetical protein